MNYIFNSQNKSCFSRVKNFVIGGEVFSEHTLDLIKHVSPASKVYNIYGPTETTICVMVDELTLGKQITIGKPITNTQIYIVDVQTFASFGITVLNGDGITECGPIVSVNRNKINVAGSVGLPLCCNEVKISEDGEVLVKGENLWLVTTITKKKTREPLLMVVYALVTWDGLMSMVRCTSLAESKTSLSSVTEKTFLPKALSPKFKPFPMSRNLLPT